MAVLALGMFVRARRQLALVERDRAAAEQELRVAQARQLERTRLAREMHDVLGHRLSLLSLEAGALELWPDASPAEIARTAGVIRSSAHGALEDLREVIGVLRAVPAGDGPDGVPERPQPTLADVPMLIEESRKAGMRVRLECEVADLGAVPEAVGRTAFRIVQEGVTNARKHADRAAVSVAVRGRGGRRPYWRDPQSMAGEYRPHHADPRRGYGHHRARRADGAHWRAAGTRPHRRR